MKSNRKVILAKKSMELTVTQEHIDSAIPGDMCSCVVAQSLIAQMGEIIDTVAVGRNRTKIYSGGKFGQILVYKTPKVLRDALPYYDRTGIWRLPVGKFTLLPCPILNSKHTGSNTSRHKKKTTFKYIPSRKASVNFNAF